MSWKLMEGEGAMERRIRVVGLCLIAVFALSAVVVASAQATVEIGQCAKIVKSGKVYKGRYISKSCGNKAGEEATPEEQGLGGRTNKYEWKPGAAGNGNFSGKGKEVKLTAGELEVVCKGSVSTGAIRGQGAGTGTIESKFIFKDCLQPKNEKKKCSTHGKEPGEIETKELVAALEEGPEPAKEPQLAYVHKGKGNLAEPAEPWVEFECIEKKFTVNGTLVGKDTQTENEMTKRGGVEFSALVGSQELVASFPSAFSEEPETAPVTLSFIQSNKFEASYELRQQ